MKKSQEYFLAFAGVVVVLSILYGISVMNSPTGQAVLDLDSNIRDGVLEGVLRFSLKEGELIPSNSKLVLETVSGEKEFTLSEIVNMNTTSGNFYSENSPLSGSGEGYGFEGEKTIYPSVSFSLNILSGSTTSNNTQNNKETISDSSSSGNSISENKEENPVQGNSESNTEVQNNTSENTTDSNISQQSNNTQPNESENVSVSNSENKNNTVKKISSETVSDSNTESGNASENPETTDSPETQDSGADSLGTSETSASDSTETSESQTSSDSQESSDAGNAEPVGNESAPITGNFVLNMFRGIANLFFTLTGQASLDVSSTINGEVSANNDFVYNLNSGESAELVSGSVVSGSNSLPDDAVSVRTENGKVVVTTDYSEIEKGFGSEYITGNEKVLEINISDLNVNISSGGMNLTLEYNETPIVSLSSSIENGSIIASSSNVTDTLNFSLERNISLTESERNILRSNFNNASVKTTNAEIVNGRILMRYEIGDYWAEFSYDKELTEPLLLEQSSHDKTQWLKNIAKKLSKTKESQKKLDSFIGQEQI